MLWGGERIVRHNHIRVFRDVLFNTYFSAALGPTNEDGVLLPSSKSIPTNILLTGWSGVKNVIIFIYIELVEIV